jgi:hypothetical protein
MIAIGVESEYRPIARSLSG